MEYDSQPLISNNEKNDVYGTTDNNEIINDFDDLKINGHHNQIKKVASIDNCCDNKEVDDKERNQDDDSQQDIFRNEIDSSTNHDLNLWPMMCIVSTAFAYGCIMTTLFMIILPVECLRIQDSRDGVEKSVALGIFVIIAGITQLISPLVGKLSDTYEPPSMGNPNSCYYELGMRTPFYVLGSISAVFGLLIQLMESYYALWERYSVGFAFHMIGLNIMYAMMLAMIPDQIPSSQTGIANGVLALLLVLGSIFGFVLFHSILSKHIQYMYALYACVVILCSILTYTYGHERDVECLKKRMAGEQKQHLLPVKVSPSSERIKKNETEKKNTFMAPIVDIYHVLFSMLIQPFIKLDWNTFIYESYTIDIDKHHDFFWVTVSRLFYYCGMSVQTFFLYFLQDIIHVNDNTEGAVATLAIVAQCAGALTCYPVGYISDQVFSRERKPFVYLSCFLLALTTSAIIFSKSYHDVILCSCALGAANGMYLTMETSLAIDTLPEINDEKAQLLGIWGVAAFLGSAIGPMINGPLLYFIGTYHRKSAIIPTNNVDSITSVDDTDAYSLAGYAAILSLSSVYFLCSAMSLQFVSSKAKR